MPELGKNQIKLVMFLDPYEALINFDVYGKVTFYGIGDSKLRNKILFEKQYVTESMTQKMEAFQVTCAKFDPNFNLLILGD